MKPLATINPSFNSPLVSEIFALEKLRYTRLAGTTPRWLFFDLKEIMHILESVASARIEGNRTTVVGAAIDSLDSEKPAENEDFQELRNIRKAIQFIEDTLSGPDPSPITPSLIREIQKTIVEGLKRDGSKTPGAWRTEQVVISNSPHQPPEHIEVPSLIRDLCDYIGNDNEGKMDIIKIATAHHRFAAIHPFDNGNGRTARLLTYAMLVQSKFIDKTKRTVLNPSAIFCIDRQRYYDMLAMADTGADAALEEWCLYVARGITAEMDRVNRLLDREYAVANIIEPALLNALDSKFISRDEHEILKIAMQKDIIQAQDVKHLFGTSASAAVQTSRVLSNMKDKKLLMVHPAYQKKYVMRFANNYLLHDVLKAMDRNGLLVVENEAS
ncbi:MAG TPA: Fic family protein [Candidatus Saccharimonadales bacterium]|nr:Fic family protein [Candidatus Saccharimonadales bacterium]